MDVAYVCAFMQMHGHEKNDWWGEENGRKMIGGVRLLVTVT